MNEFEVVLSYTFRVRAEHWSQAEEMAHAATMPLPDTIRHPQLNRRPELVVDVGPGFEVKEVKDAED